MPIINAVARVMLAQSVDSLRTSQTESRARPRRQLHRDLARGAGAAPLVHPQAELARKGHCIREANTGACRGRESLIPVGVEPAVQAGPGMSARSSV
jgi:hypothetical protein